MFVFFKISGCKQHNYINRTDSLSLFFLFTFNVVSVLRKTTFIITHSNFLDGDTIIIKCKEDSKSFFLVRAFLSTHSSLNQ